MRHEDLKQAIFSKLTQKHANDTQRGK